MIKPRERFFSGSGSLITGGPYTWHVADLDQRRHFAVTYDPTTPIDPDDYEALEGTEEICRQELAKHVDDLGPGVFGFRFSEPDGPITVTTSPDDDVTTYPNNHPLPALELPFPIKVISITQLVELDRLAPQVDLVSYHDGPLSAAGKDGTQRAVFKYWFMESGRFRTWLELGDWCRLPRDHPHIVPFDAVVLEPVRGSIVGFTSLFVPGGTLQDTATTRPFQLRWFRQLLSVVDDLNYGYGVMHQDIAPRNLLIDEDNNLRVFDLNYAATIGEDYCTTERDDTKGVVFTLYEIVTLDTHYRKVPFAEQDPEAVMRLESWPQHPDVQPDADVSAFRDALRDWVARRRARPPFSEPHKDTWVRWPFVNTPPLVYAQPTGTHDPEKSVLVRARLLFRRDLVRRGEPFYEWERPASYRMRDVVANAAAGGGMEAPNGVVDAAQLPPRGDVLPENR
ncbi:hypothetical protein VTK73DRAFT_9382 [Phialemonium thermophilum]|uniref:EKC/KEOPS complex subunit BUD32 n=1 Tax=Phialemonium thermophilum TaxID=223376 RepID=A0ABR3W2V9_9PEZI